MKVIIAGCGKVGKTILQSMIKEKHEVLVLDSDAKVIKDTTNEFDVIGLCGSGTSYADLKEAGVDKAELFIAVTASDELNMLSCYIAKKLGANHTVARIRNADLTGDNLEFIKQSLELNMVINPELLTAKVIHDIIKLPSVTKVESFASGAFEMLELSVKNDCAIIGLPLIELRKKLQEKFLVLAIQRGEDVFIPNGQSTIANGDKICVIASIQDVQRLLKSFGFLAKPIRDVMIIGASKTSLYLSKLLSVGNTSVKIIEKSQDKCLLASETLDNKVMIINGDGMSQEVLKEEGIDGAGAFVALTGEDEENILMSFYASKQNTEKIITKVNRNELLSISENLGLDTIVSPKKAVADVLTSYARALENTIGSKIETLYTVMNGVVEVAEFKVLPDFSLTGKLIKDLPIKANVLIAGIVRNGISIIPGGFDEIKEGDGVIIVSSSESISDLEDIVK